MFQPNGEHLQSDMFSTAMQLSEKRRQRLVQSWAGTFYRDFFCRIDESIFACLYSDRPSRPNVPVNVLVGFEVLKAGHGWSDEQAYDAVCFDVQVRYALGLHNLTDDDFTLRTVYNFRRAVAEHAGRSGQNLFEAVFEQVTGEQMQAYEIASTTLRMDSTQVASNIRNTSRLQLLVEVLKRVHRELDEEDGQRLEEEFAPYVRKSSRQYAYRMRGDEPQAHLIRIGTLMARLVKDLKAKYQDTDAYAVLSRVLAEHFLVDGSVVLHRFDEDISAQSLQSPDDPEATYRRKAGRRYRGYVANLTETCDDTNDLQLIVAVTVEPNSADDGQMLVDAVDSLTERTDVDTLYTDGGYNGPQVDDAMASHGIELHQTGIRGGSAQGLGRDAFDWEVDDDSQKPVAVSCPGGQRVVVERGRKGHTFLARFDDKTCSECALRDQCPAKARKRRPERVLWFTDQQVHAARRVRRSRVLRQSGRNPRAAVEATVWSVTAPFPRGHVPHRRHARVTMYTIASAAMVNVRRIAAATQLRAGNGVAAARLLRSRHHARISRLLAGIRGLLARPLQHTLSWARFAPTRNASPAATG